MARVLTFRPPHPFNIVVEHHQGYASYFNHTHDYAELVLIVKGSAIHIVNGKEYPLQIGDVYVINPGTVHGTRNSITMEERMVFFLPGVLNSLDSSVRTLSAFHTLFLLAPTDAETNFTCRLKLNPADLREALNICRRLEVEIQQQREGSEPLVRALFTELIVHLCRKYVEPQAASTAVSGTLQIARVTSHIETNFREKLSLDGLAGLAGVSRRHLTRLFRKAYGISPMEYVIRLRLRHAAALLAHGSKTISDIAFECGFTDSNYFSRQFKTLMKCSPTDYRTGRRII